MIRKIMSNVAMTIECKDTLCYTAVKGGDNMSKTNSEIVKDYHGKLVEIKVRLPKADEEHGIPDYPSLIRERAEELGLINTKGKDKGKGSANAYILHLIAEDLGIEINTISQIDK